MMSESLDTVKATRLLNMLETAVIITDAAGASVFENVHYQKLAQRGGFDAAIVRESAAAALRQGQTATTSADRFLLVSVPVPETAPPLVMTQVNDVADILALKKELEDSQTRNTDYAVRLNKLKLRDCIANSASMIKVFEKAKQVANYPTTVLLVGETGVGKEVVATFIHRNSDRADKAFIKVNCSAIPEQLLESELFGYESGAFTGAKTKGKAGLFELANNGTLLLDEIGDMALPLQAKMLRVLQENEIMRLGGQKVIPLNVRVISSTNRDIKAMMSEGRFSEALYYRLNVVELSIPPLRDRREDILPLAAFYKRHFCDTYKLDKAFSPEILECFMRYGWPGNIRELRNIVENAVVSSEGSVIGLENLPQRMTVDKDAPVQSPMEPISMRGAVRNLQKEAIQNALATYGSLRKAAQALDMDSTTLYRLAKKLDIPTS